MVCKGWRIAAVALLFASLGASSQVEARPKPASLERVSRELIGALIAGNAAKAKSLVIAHGELAGLTRRAPSAKKYRKMVDRWVDKRVRELGEAQRRGKKLALGKPRIVDVHILSKGSKLHRRVVFATVHAKLLVDGKERRGLPLFFVDVGARWKLSIKK